MSKRLPVSTSGISRFVNLVRIVVILAIALVLATMVYRAIENVGLP